MRTSTKASSPYRDKYKESCFYDAYKINTIIETSNFIDSSGNWDKAIVKFKCKGTIFGLIEIFNSGADNSTNHVILEVEGKELFRFDRYIDAELKLVELMRKL